MLHIAIDRGGTFTDLVAYYNGKYYHKKILSESAKYDDSNTQAIRDFLKEVFSKDSKKIDIKEFDSIKFGTTVVTNALLERSGEALPFC